jgi:NAD(P)-dependent dehydrogenase (short-subunit alcohol dehydrogenase family)
MSTNIEHFDLSGRKAMVVGVENPAGAAIARAYAEAGADVALCVLKADDAVMTAKRIQKEIEAQGSKSGVYVMDVTLGRNVQVTTRQVAKELGGLDIVASCPDLFLGKPIAKTTDAELLQVMTHNFNSQFYVARSAAGELAKNEAGGNLILLSHILGERGAKNTAAYGAAHAATQSLVRSLAQELGSSQISVNGISLGWMDWMDDRIDPDVEDAGRAVRFSIMKRAGEAEEVGPMAVWLSGSAVGYVSGQVFTIDGGLLQHL